MKLKTKIKIVTAVIAFLPFLVFTVILRLFPLLNLRDVIENVIIIIFSVDIILMIWIYYSVAKPMEQLKKATRMIKKGNLDYELESDRKDEFGELFADFEQMRLRLKENAEEKIQFDEESREMISNISHDLKTPLTAIRGYVEGIMDGVADTPEKVDKYIRIIYNKTNELNQLISELTVYSQLDTNRIPFNFQKVNLARYFEDCVEEVTMDLEAKGITVSYSNNVPADTIIIADPEQFRRAINNIVSNSIKYMGKENGSVEIRLIDEGDFVHMEFKDSGKGIAPKDLPLIFERFYRTDSSRNSSQGGSGIGLSVVQKIVEAHGGRVWATSKEHEGTTIHFVFRKYVETILTEEAGQAEAAPEKKKKGKAAKGGKHE